MIKKFICWGHKLHTHTHSFIHQEFVKTFAHLGWETHWFDNNDDVSDFDFSNSLFLTEGQVDAEIPVRSDSHYILHNCNLNNYPGIKNFLMLQVYTKDVKRRAEGNSTYEKIDKCSYLEKATNCDVLYAPWASDLLPHQFYFSKAALKRENTCSWVGTIGGKKFGNDTQLAGWQKACKEHNIEFKQYTRLSDEEHRTAIEKSFMAPAINGQWQVENHYLPCRIWKNISYGQAGLTNNEGVKEVLGDHVTYNPNTYDLFFDGMKVKDDIPRIQAAMREVQQYHTYINRVNNILDVLGLEA